MAVSKSIIEIAESGLNNPIGLSANEIKSLCGAVLSNMRKTTKKRKKK